MIELGSKRDRWHGHAASTCRPCESLKRTNAATVSASTPGGAEKEMWPSLLSSAQPPSGRGGGGERLASIKSSEASKWGDGQMLAGEGGRSS